MIHTGDPLGVYRLPLESQLEILGLRWYEHEEHEEAAAGASHVRTQQQLEPVDLVDPDPEHGQSLPRPQWLVAVSSEARERSDRFRVA